VPQRADRGGLLLSQGRCHRSGELGCVRIACPGSASRVSSRFTGRESRIVAEDYPVNPGVRSRLPLGLAQGRAAVVQALCHAALENQPAPTVSELAARASVSPSTTSRTIGDLVEHGLVSKPDRYGPVVVFDTAALARLLAERTELASRAGRSRLLLGASSFDVAARFSVEAERAQVGSAITGRVGASLFGILGAGNPEQVRVRVKCEPKQLTDVCRRLQVERVVREEANIAVAADPWGSRRARRRAERPEWRTGALGISAQNLVRHR